MELNESAIQQSCVIWFNNEYCMFGHHERGIIFHVPNQNQQRYTNIGVLAGVSDIIIVFRGKILFIEMKDATGTQKINQKGFQARIESNGYKYYLCRSLEEFKEVILKEYPE